MKRSDLTDQIRNKASFLCVGLDTDPERIPPFLREKHTDLKTAVVEFNKAIINATAPYTVSYKLNLAFYEAMGLAGWQAFEETLSFIPENCFVIADAKRGDIGNTSRMYAKAFFETYGCDALTLSPYMGNDSISPFLDAVEKGKWAVLLALTSNSGSLDFQQQTLKNGKALFEEVLERSKYWGSTENTMYVVGATKSGESFKKIREIIPEHFLLVPGVGAQGGSLEDVARYGMTKDCGLLVNSSRGIIYASKNEDFAEAAEKQAEILQSQMKQLLETFHVI